MKFALVALMLVIPSVAFAQAQITPSQAALQIENIINQLAQGAEQSIVLQKENVDLRKQIADMKAKYEPGPKKP